jgi:hypothetical protein
MAPWRYELFPLDIRCIALLSRGYTSNVNGNVDYTLRFDLIAKSKQSRRA